MSEVPNIRDASDKDLRHLVAQLAGILAHRQGAYETATQLRRIADALLKRRVDA